MVKRYKLVLFLFCLSICVGFLAAIPQVVGTGFFYFGARILWIIMAILFAAALAAWELLRRNRHTRDPQQSVKHQGRAFLAWFITHNLLWSLLGSFSIWGLFMLFGPRPWVVAVSAGALACTSFALIGSCLIKQGKMLALCWQSPIPDGLEGFWARTGAALVLRERYECAAEHDQHQPTPILWKISRVYDRPSAANVDRSVDLMDRRFPAAKLKKEWLHRLKALAVLFIVTAVLAALPGLFGITSSRWDRVPDGWPSSQTKTEKQQEQKQQKQEQQQKQQTSSQSKPDSQDNQEKTQQNQNQQQSRDQKNNQSKQGQKGQQGQQGQQSQEGQQDQQGKEGQQGQQGEQGKEGQQGHQSQEGQKQGAEGKDSKNQSGRQGQDKNKGGDKDSKGKPGGKEPGGGQQQGKPDGGPKEQGPDTGGDQAEGAGQKSGGPGKGASKEGDSEQGQDGKGGPGEGSGKKPGSTTEGGDSSGQGSTSETGAKGKGKKGESSTAGEGSDTKGKESETGGQGEQGQQAADAKQPGSKQGKGDSKAPGSGGEGYGTGSPDDVPDMASDPQPLSDFPSRDTGMVSLDLPTLTPTGGAGDPQKKDTPEQLLPKKGPAPTSPFKTGEQDRRLSKPEQYLPNWILRLLTPTKDAKKTTKTKKR